MVPDDVIQSINGWLHKKSGKTVSIKETKVLSGGCINDCYALYTPMDTFFIKYNLVRRFPEMFTAESKGLLLLKSTTQINVPEVLYTGKTGEYSFLLLEYIPEGQKVQGFWKSFGRQLAGLHRLSHTSFGLDHDNYIGSIPQKNHFYPQWDEFLIMNRLQPLISQAYNQGLLNRGDISGFDRLYTRIQDILPTEKPSLLHGDLWSGNFMVNVEGQPTLIDPAVYFGHREMDIAMTKLFGGFANDFYQYYNDEYPLEKGWENRLEFNQLYPLLVHALLFGASYALQVRSIIRKY
jgi:fructosamine-3-kinase